MSAEHEVKTKSGKYYYIEESGGKYYVRKPGDFFRHSVGTANSMTNALALVENDAGSKVTSVS
jgi:hypothetical protein